MLLACGSRLAVDRRHHVISCFSRPEMTEAVNVSRCLIFHVAGTEQRGQIDALYDDVLLLLRASAGRG